jgi:hypothetical protein
MTRFVEVSFFLQLAVFITYIIYMYIVWHSGPAAERSSLLYDLSENAI